MNRRQLVLLWCAAVLVAGVATLALVLVLGGGAPQPAPPGLDDPGRLPAWLGAIANYLSLIAGVVTVGLGLIGSGVLDLIRRTSWTAAAGAAAMWAAISVLQIGLVSWELRGQAELLDSSRVRALLVQLGLVVLAAVCWSFGRRALVSAVALVVSCGALLPLVLVGHPRSADNPVLAGVSVSIHVVSAALWVGGLAGLAWLAVSGEVDWSDPLPRYSRLALVCVAALTASGLATTIERLDGPSELLTSRYGALVLLKIVLLCGLVVAGWMQRQYVFERSPVRAVHFLPVAGLELIVMTLTLALASALARTPPPV